MRLHLPAGLVQPKSHIYTISLAVNERLAIQYITHMETGCLIMKWYITIFFLALLTKFSIIIQIIELIYWLKTEGRQFWGTIGHAFPPILAVIIRIEWLVGVLKWVGWLGPGCFKTVCPMFKPRGLFWKLHFWNQQTKLHYLHCQLRQYIDFHLDSLSSLVCQLKTLR